jgi:hypothetical protein
MRFFPTNRKLWDESIIREGKRRNAVLFDKSVLKPKIKGVCSERKALQRSESPANPRQNQNKPIAFFIPSYSQDLKGQQGQIILQLSGVGKQQRAHTDTGSPCSWTLNCQ